MDENFKVVKMGRKKLTRDQEDLFVKDAFKKLFPLIEEGLTIKQACKVIGLDTRKLYLNMTAAQKAELQMVKTANRVY